MEEIADRVLTMALSITLRDDYLGFNTGNGEKLSYNQAAGLALL